MKCKKIISYLNAYVDGELSQKQQRVVEAHLKGCESCRKQIEEIRRMDELFQGTLPVPPVPDGLAARIMANARQRKPVETTVRPLPLLRWNPLQWIARLSMPMRLAACGTVLLAFVAGMSLDGKNAIRRNMAIEQETDLYGLEWFAPTPPASLGLTYIAMVDQPYKEGSEQ